MKRLGDYDPRDYDPRTKKKRKIAYLHRLPKDADYPTDFDERRPRFGNRLLFLSNLVEDQVGSYFKLFQKMPLEKEFQRYKPWKYIAPCRTGLCRRSGVQICWCYHFPNRHSYGLATNKHYYRLSGDTKLFKNSEILTTHAYLRLKRYDGRRKVRRLHRAGMPRPPQE